MQRLAKMAKRAARKVRFPAGFKGSVLWCPRCYQEIGRFADGAPAPQAEQQQMASDHRAKCMRRKMAAV